MTLLTFKVYTYVYPRKSYTMRVPAEITVEDLEIISSFRMPLSEIIISRSKNKCMQIIFRLINKK